MNKRRMRKALKAAFPTLVLAGGGLVLGHQLIIMLAGVGMLLEHRFSYGKWWDKNRLICHGKLGVILLMGGCFVTLVGIL